MIYVHLYADFYCGRQKWETRWEEWMLCGLNNQEIQEEAAKPGTSRELRIIDP